MVLMMVTICVIIAKIEILKIVTSYYLKGNNNTFFYNILTDVIFFIKLEYYQHNNK